MKPGRGGGASGCDMSASRDPQGVWPRRSNVCLCSGGIGCLDFGRRCGTRTSNLLFESVLRMRHSA